jgi:hypothetical protein
LADAVDAIIVKLLVFKAFEAFKFYKPKALKQTTRVTCPALCVATFCKLNV